MTGRRLLGACSLLVLLWGGAPGVGRTAAPAGPPATEIGLIAADSAHLPAARSSGARAVRVLVDWSAIEAHRGRPAWSDLDRAVAAVSREGLTPVAVLAYTPQWASIGTGTDLLRPEIYSRQPPRALGEWERFVGLVAARYRDQVRDWQVWTYLGLPEFRGTGSEYLALLHSARTRIRAHVPGARVAASSPAGVDLAFLASMLAGASQMHDAIALTPRGLQPEALLRPLGVLRGRMRGTEKPIWLDWSPDPRSAADDPAAWQRALVVAHAMGVERFFVPDPARLDRDLGPVGRALAGKAFAGYLVREPDSYLLVFAGPGEALMVCWATAEGRMLEIPAPWELRATTPAGGTVPIEVQDGRRLLRLSTSPVLVSGLPAAAVEEAVRTAGTRGPLLPVVGPDRDYGRAGEVYANLGQPPEERGLYNTPYRTRSNGAVEPVETPEGAGVRTDVGRGVIYVYFDVDDTFLYFAEGRTLIEITIEVMGARAERQVGFNLLYDSIGGYRFTPWQWVDVGSGWVRHSFRLTDANMANTWGYDFAINAAGNRGGDLVVRRVAVRRIAPP